jgi:hypothetical protein
MQYCFEGHPVPRPEFVNEKPQVGGRRSGLLAPFPRTVDEETFLRGAWPTDRNGVVQFTSMLSFQVVFTQLKSIHSTLQLLTYSAIFPGYYTGRATHIHTKVYPEWKVLPNGTFTSNHLAHVGQFFFDDEINLRIDNVRTFSTFACLSSHHWPLCHIAIFEFGLAYYSLYHNHSQM